jgi:hypothetical protein
MTGMIRIILGWIRFGSAGGMYLVFSLLSKSLGL